MYDDFKEFLSVLNAKGVKYLIVGGYAVSYHAEPRATKDLNIFIATDAANAKAIFEALKEFKAPIKNLKPHDLVAPGKFYRMGSPPIMIDIMPEISGVEFERAWKRRVTVAIDRELKAHVISADDLIAAKIAAGRAQDIADAEAIRRSRPVAAKKTKRSPRRNPRGSS